eukprot:TRINITY_DN67210_c4_g2_i1.p1 TRINITY_DN67210_c4_g2~~TRINITY_DN67210_c4_g2_i1.p1  ORF type:complete len:150 (-),score=5.31 TRINITY_DN67210_c4_g2_i1:1201-1650(-)
MISKNSTCFFFGSGGVYLQYSSSGSFHSYGLQYEGPYEYAFNSAQFTLLSRAEFLAGSAFGPVEFCWAPIFSVQTGPSISAIGNHTYVTMNPAAAGGHPLPMSWYNSSNIVDGSAAKPVEVVGVCLFVPLKYDVVLHVLPVGTPSPGNR